MAFNAVTVLVRLRLGRHVALHAAAVASSMVSFFVMGSMAGAGLVELALADAGCVPEPPNQLPSAGNLHELVC